MRTSQTKADDIDILSLMGALKRNLPKLVLFTGLVGAGTYGVLSMVAPRYVSDTQIAIVPKATNPFPDAKREGSAGESITPRVDKEAINTHVRALGATDLVLAVADKLKLADQAEFNNATGEVDALNQLMRTIGLGGPRPGQAVQDRVLENVFKQLEISAARETRYINVRFSSINPQLAADFANTLAESYRAKLITVPVNETEAAVTALEPKVDQLRREVLDAESAVEVYRAETDQFKSGAQGTPVNDQRMAALNDELTKAEAARADTESRWRAARDLAQLDSADILPEVQKSQLMQSLINQRVRLERQISEAQASLLPGHPRMRQLTADLAGLKTTIKAEVGKIVQGMEKDAKASAFRSEQIIKQINELKTKVVNTSGSEAQLRALESTAKSKRTELEALQKQLENNRTLKATKAVPIEAQIVSAARPTSVPIWPKKGPWTALASIAAFLLGAVSIVTGAMISGATPQTGPKSSGGGSTRRIPAQAARTADGMVPAMAARSAASLFAKGAADKGQASVKASAPVNTADNDGSIPPPAPAKPVASAESVETMRPDAAAAANRNMSWNELARGLEETEDDGHQDSVDPVHELAYRLVDRGGSEPGYRTLITGESANADGAPEALEIVSVLRATGRAVVLIDWNLDGAGISTEFGLANRVGLTDFITGKAQLSDVVTKLPGTDIHVIPCGQALSATDTTLDAEQLATALDSLDEHYHQIVVSGGHDDARDLFHAIQGRFDCGITVGDQPDPLASSNVFLGFEVADIDVIRHDRQPAVPAARANGQHPTPRSGANDEAFA